MNAIVRTFRAPDPRTALSAVKEALGNDAIILGTREIGGMWGRKEVEITAAVPGSDEARAATRAVAPAPRGQGLEGDVASLRRIVDELRTELRATRAEPRNTRPDGVPTQAMGLARRLMQRGIEAPIVEEIVRAAMRDAPSTREKDVEEAA